MAASRALSTGPCGRLPREAAQAAAGASRGRRAAMLPLDVARSDTFPEFADALARTLRDTFGRDRFEFLINNAGHGVHATGAAPMLLTHAVAIPLSAVLLILAATLADLLTSSIRALSPRPAPRIPGRPRPAVDAPVLVSGPVFGGPGVRGPPVAA